MASVTAMNADVGLQKQNALDTLIEALKAPEGDAGSRTEAILRAEDVLQAMIAMADTLKQKGYKYS